MGGRKGTSRVNYYAKFKVSSQEKTIKGKDEQQAVVTGGGTAALEWANWKKGEGRQVENPGRNKEEV